MDDSENSVLGRFNPFKRKKQRSHEIDPEEFNRAVYTLQAAPISILENIFQVKILLIPFPVYSNIFASLSTEEQKELLNEFIQQKQEKETERAENV